MIALDPASVSAQVLMRHEEDPIFEACHTNVHLFCPQLIHALSQK